MAACMIRKKLVVLFSRFIKCGSTFVSSFNVYLLIIVIIILIFIVHLMFSHIIVLYVVLKKLS